MIIVFESNTDLSCTGDIIQNFFLYTIPVFIPSRCGIFVAKHIHTDTHANSEGQDKGHELPQDHTHSRTGLSLLLLPGCKVTTPGLTSHTYFIMSEQGLWQ